MTWILRLAFRNVLRNRRRSLLTVVTVMLGTGLLTLGLSWINGVLSEMLGSAAASAGEVRLITEEYAQREAVRPLYENIDHTGPVVEAIESLEGLAAYPVIRAGVTMTVGRRSATTSGSWRGRPWAISGMCWAWTSGWWRGSSLRVRGRRPCWAPGSPRILVLPLETSWWCWAKPRTVPCRP